MGRGIQFQQAWSGPPHHGRLSAIESLGKARAFLDSINDTRVWNQGLGVGTSRTRPIPQRSLPWTALT